MTINEAMTALCDELSTEILDVLTQTLTLALVWLDLCQLAGDHHGGGRALLAYLAVEADRPHARAALAALLWPDRPDDLALRNLAPSLVRRRATRGRGRPRIATSSWANGSTTCCCPAAACRVR